MKPRLPFTGTPHSVPSLPVDFVYWPPLGRIASTFASSSALSPRAATLIGKLWSSGFGPGRAERVPTQLMPWLGGA